jgi:hypothetical protein
MEKIKDIEDEKIKNFVIEYFNYLRTLPDQTL